MVVSLLRVARFSVVSVETLIARCEGVGVKGVQGSALSIVLHCKQIGVRSLSLYLLLVIIGRVRLFEIQHHVCSSLVAGLLATYI